MVRGSCYVKDCTNMVFANVTGFSGSYDYCYYHTPPHGDGKIYAMFPFNDTWFSWNKRMEKS